MITTWGSPHIPFPGFAEKKDRKGSGQLLRKYAAKTYNNTSKVLFVDTANRPWRKLKRQRRHKNHAASRLRKVYEAWQLLLPFAGPF